MKDVFADALPDHRRSLELEGLDEQVVVLRDRLGIPHVKARTTHDAFFGQGFVHAQDRLWQMDLDRRRAAGRSAEVIGRKGVTYDVYTRRLGLVAAARADYQTLDAEARAPLDAYAEGVNAAIASHPLPAEMVLLDIEPEPWEGWHCAAVMKARHVLMGSIGPKLWRERAKRALGSDVSKAFCSPHGREDLLIVPPGAREWFEADAYTDLLTGDVSGDGSNNWAVHGSRTASGLPLLAGDPHRTLEVPNVYYQNHVACDSFDVIGLSIPGIPGMFHFGHNQRVAWCITHAMADSQDLFVERFAPDGRTYEYEGSQRDAERRTETIDVRGSEPVEIDVIQTVNGSVVFGHPDANTAISMRWTGSDRPNQQLSVILPMLQASSVEELERTMRPWVDPCNCFVSADVQGDISFLHRGRVPIRDRANAWSPVPGWTGAHAWNDDVPFEELPRMRNPEEGVIVTANNRVVGSTYPHHLGMDYAAPYRATRVLERLASAEDATPEDMASIHADNLSLSARPLLAILEGVDPTDGRSADARKLLLAWDGRMSADAWEPTIFARLRELVATLLLEEGPLAALNDNPFREEPYANTPIARVRSALPRLMAARDTAILDGRSWEQVVSQALDRTIDSLERDLGPEPSQWLWGRVHFTVARHPLSSMLPEQAGFLDPPPRSMDGDGDTVMAAGHDNGHTVLHASVARYVFDLAAWDNSRWVVPLGSSGHPASPHYTDQAEAWAGARLFPMLYSWHLVEQDAETRQTLAPR